MKTQTSKKEIVLCYVKKGNEYIKNVDGKKLLFEIDAAYLISNYTLDDGYEVEVIPDEETKTRDKYKIVENLRLILDELE